jgi:hypothetical protein
MSLHKLFLFGNTAGISGFLDFSAPDPGKTFLRQKYSRPEKV